MTFLNILLITISLAAWSSSARARENACSLDSPEERFTRRSSGNCEAIDQDCLSIVKRSWCTIYSGSPGRTCSWFIEEKCNYAKPAMRQQCEEYREGCKNRLKACLILTRRHCLVDTVEKSQSSQSGH